MNNNQLEECIAYFKSKKVFHKLLEGLRDKYIGLDRIGGSVRLTSLKQEDKTDLEGFFGRSFQQQKVAVISSTKMQDALRNSKFEQVNLEQLLRGYFKSSLETKKERGNRVAKERQKFFQHFIRQYANTFSGNWLRAIYEEKGKEYRFLLQKHSQDKYNLEKTLETAMNAGYLLPVFENRTERLAVFSARVSGDPHYFDEGSLGNRILTYLLEYYYRMDHDEQPKINSSKGRYRIEVKNEQLYYVGLLKDDISNYTTAYGIRCIKKNGEFHKGIEGYYYEHQPVQISLLTLGDITSIQTNKRSVYIVENPAVFSELITLKEDIAFVCTNGQLRLASIILLDLFYEQGYKMYYAGDFDPEGLQIAAKLLRRYDKQLCLWRYQQEDYDKAVSDVTIAQERLNKLERVTEEQLIAIKNRLLKEKRAGYQETLIEEYKKDMEDKEDRLGSRIV